MVNFFKLVRNEQMKLFKQKGSWVMVGILVAVILLAATMIKIADNQQSNRQNGSKAVQTSNTANNQVKEQPDDAKEQSKNGSSSVETNNNGDSKTKDIWDFFNKAGIGVAQIILLFLIIIAASSVAKEFSQGTIKLLLIRPSKRWKILLSKYTATILFGTYFLVIWFVMSYIVGGIFFGFADFNQTIEITKNGVLTNENVIMYILQQLLLAVIPGLILWTAFAFMISSVFRTSALAIGLSIFLYFIGGTITGVLIGFKLNWIAKFTPFINAELSQYVYGKPIISGMTMVFSVCVVVAYILIFKIITYTSFLKRDVM